MAEKSRTKSYAQENAEKGAFTVLWGKQWGLSVYPAYGIDKMKFSFIEVGSEGKGNSFDIYMDTIHDGTQCFDNWAFDILHGIFARTLAAEKQAGEKYPKAYNYLTGETADKSVGICNANTEGKYVINASKMGDNGKKIYANVQATFHDLRRLAEYYQMTYEKRMREIAQLSVKASSEYHTQNENARPEAVEQQKSSKYAERQEKPKQEAKTTQQPQEKPKAEPTKAAAIKESKAKEAKGSQTIKVKTLTPITYMKNNKDMALRVVTQSGETKNLLFMADIANKVDDQVWSNFLSKTHVEGYTFTAVFTMTEKGSLVFQKFAA